MKGNKKCTYMWSWDNTLITLKSAFLQSIHSWVEAESNLVSSTYMLYRPQKVFLLKCRTTSMIRPP